MKSKKENENVLPSSLVPKPHIKVGLARALGLSDAVFIGIGALLGGGIFTLTGLALGYAGPSLILVIVLNGIIASMTALVYAELGSVLPEAGGAFIWAKRGLGDLAGHITGWISWFANAVACGLYSISFGFYAGIIVFLIILPVFGINISFSEGDLFQVLVAILTILFVGYINFKGVSGTSRFGKTIVYFEIAVLLIFGIFGALSFLKRPDFSNNFLPFFPYGISGLLAAMGLMYIGFEGSEIIVQSGEEIKNPKKNLPRAIFISLGIIVFLYVLAIFSVLGGPQEEGGGWQTMAQAGQGVLIRAGSFFMPGFEWIMIFGGLFAALAALNATIFSSSRVSFSMARAGFLPRVFSTIHPKNKTPHIAVIISTLLILVIAAFLPLKDVAVIVDLLFIFLFLQLHFTLIALRKKLPDIERPFKVPFHPIPSLIAIFAYLVLVFQLFHVSPVGIFIVLFWLLSGFLLYYAYVKPRAFEKVEKRVIFEEKVRMAEEKKYRILLPISPDINWQNILTFSLVLAKERDAEISVLRIKQIPRPRPLHIDEDELEKERIFLEEVSNFCKDFHINVDILLIVARSISGTVLEVAKRENPNLLIMCWKGWAKTKGKIFGRNLDRVLREIKCDLIVARINHLNDFKNILLPSVGGPHTKFAGKVARAIAQNFDSKINVAYVASKKEIENNNVEEKLISTVSKLEIGDWPYLKTEILQTPSSSHQSVAYQIVQRSQDFGCVLMDSARGRIFREMIFGSIPEIVARNSTCSLILVKSHTEIIQPFLSYLKSRI